MITRAIGFFLLVAGFASLSYGFDRDKLHREQLKGLDLNARLTHRLEIPFSTTLSPLAADIQISESGSPAMFTQDHVRLASLTSGDWLAVWHDNRNGSQKIWRQRLNSSGASVGGNVLAAGSTIGADYVDPEICTDSLGLIYLYYRDRTRGLIYGSRFNEDLTPDLPAFVVNDSSNNAFAGPYDIAVFPDGRTVVVWENYGVSGSTIQMRVYNAAGSTVAGPTTVHSDAGNTQRWVPTVAAQSGSGYLVAWEDYRDDQADIYARLFTGGGASIGNDFALVPSPASTSQQYAPQVVYSSLNKYVIGWIDRRQGQEVYLQRYDPVSGLAGSNTLISAGDSTAINWDLNLASSTDGSILASWGASQQTNLIQSRRFGASLAPLGSVLTINQDSNDRRWGPSASFHNVNNFGLAWTEFVDDDADIRMMSFDTLGVRNLASEIVLNNDAVGSPASSPSMVAGTDWWRLAVFASRRRDAGDIYLQTLGYFGGLVGSNRRVNQDAAGNLQAEPSAAVADTMALVVWIDGRAVNAVPGQRIFGRYCSSYGVSNADEFFVSDSNSVAAKLSPKIAMLSSGRALIAWLDNRDGNYQVWGHWRNTDGTSDGADFRISNIGTDTQNDHLCVGTDTLSQFWVMWLDYGTTSPTVKAHIYNANKTSIGSFSWAPASTDMEDMSAAVLPAGSLAIVFTSLNGGTRDISIARISSAGTQTLLPYAFNDLAASDAELPSLSVDKAGNLAAAWIDHRAAQTAVYVQAFNPSLLPIGQNQLMTGGAPEFVESPSVLAAVGNAWAVWIDPRQNGAAVWGNYYVYEPTEVSEGTHDNLPAKFELAQNYPNPFNPNTVIEFALPRAADVKLEIFNALGQRVARPVNGLLESGTHKVVWNGQDESGSSVASGIYLYRVTADGSSLQRKMLLIK